MLPSLERRQFVLQARTSTSARSRASTPTSTTGAPGSRPSRCSRRTASSRSPRRASSRCGRAPHRRAELDWEELAARGRRALTEYVEQLGGRRAPRRSDDVAALARRIVAERATRREAALAICRAVGDAMEYMRGVTGVHTTAREAWDERKGVCQDIAHVALGALRSVGIPARYVSGYLHPDAGRRRSARRSRASRTPGSSGSAGDWRGYDPTNLVDIGERHVLVGRGRDYSDVPPLRGVYAGPGASELFVTVEITRVA